MTRQGRMQVASIHLRGLRAIGYFPVVRFINLSTATFSSAAKGFAFSACAEGWWQLNILAVVACDKNTWALLAAPPTNTMHSSLGMDVTSASRYLRPD